MAEISILPERDLQFSIDEATGFYFTSFYVSDISRALTAGEEYHVSWSGTEYVVTAEATVVNGADFVYVGNKLFVGGEDDGIPFVVATHVDTSMVGWLVFSPTEESKTVCVYQVIRDGVDVVLKDRDGNDVLYEGVKSVVLEGEDGNETVFSEGEVIEGLEFNLDLLDGDQVLKVPSGNLARKVTVKKPRNLIPGNIAEGVDIAGVVGILKTTVEVGGASNVKIASGTATGSTKYVATAEHNLGVIPDLFFAQIDSFGNVPSGTTENVYTTFLFVSNALKAALGWSYGSIALRGNSGKIYQCRLSEPIETGVIAMFPSAATTNTLTFGNTTYKAQNGGTYAWFAIGGLFNT